MKKVLLIAGVAVAVVLVAVVGFNYKYKQMSREIIGYTLKEIDLGAISDGTYRGSCTNFLVAVDLEVAVKDHRMEAISILKQRNGKGYEGRQVIDRVLKNQSLDVDAKTGATGSSKCILIAVEKALSGQK